MNTENKPLVGIIMGSTSDWDTMRNAAEALQQLGIPRQLSDIGGWDAVKLWRKYRDRGDQKALELLLKYNEEDVLNLLILRERIIAIYVDGVIGDN